MEEFKELNEVHDACGRIKKALDAELKKPLSENEREHIFAFTRQYLEYLEM